MAICSNSVSVWRPLSAARTAALLPAVPAVMRFETRLTLGSSSTSVLRTTADPGLDVTKFITFNRSVNHVLELRGREFEISIHDIEVGAASEVLSLIDPFLLLC